MGAPHRPPGDSRKALAWPSYRREWQGRHEPLESTVDVDAGRADAGGSRFFTLHRAGVIWRDGGLVPTALEGTSDCNGVAGFRIVEPTMPTWDWLVFIALHVALIAVQVGLAYLLRRAWRSLRIRQ